MKLKGIIKNNKVLKNSGWLIGERVFQMLLTLIIGSLTARYLGPSNYGVINYVASFVSIFAVFAALGIDSILIRELVADPNNEGTYVGTTLVLKLISGLLCMIASNIFMLIYEKESMIIIAVNFMQSFSLIFKSYDVFDYYFQAHLSSKFSVISKSLATIIVAIWKVYLLVNKAPVIYFGLSVTIEATACLLALIILYKYNEGPKLKFDRSIAKKLLKSGYHFIFASLMIILYTRMDKIMIGSFLSEKEVGLYSAASAISEMWLFVPLALINSLQPVILELKAKGDKLYHEKLKEMYFIVFYGSAFMCLGITLFSKYITLILYGAQYLESQKLLVILIWGGLFAVMGSARGVWIVAEDLNKYSKYYTFIGCFINLILNYVLIRWLGLIGATIATLVAQIVVCLVAPLFFAKTRESVFQIITAVLDYKTFFRKAISRVR